MVRVCSGNECMEVTTDLLLDSLIVRLGAWVDVPSSIAPSVIFKRCPTMISFALTSGVHYHDFDVRRLLCANRFWIFFLSCESLTSRQASASMACMLEATRMRRCGWKDVYVGSRIGSAASALLLSWWSLRYISPHQLSRGSRCSSGRRLCICHFASASLSEPTPQSA